MSIAEDRNQNISPQLLTVDELAVLLKVSERTIWRMRSAQQLPRPSKVGGSVRWRQPDITEWIAQGCPPGESRDNGTRR